MKVPEVVKQIVRRIAARKFRTESTVAYMLMLRGLEAFEKDGQLEEPVINFVKRIMVPMEEQTPQQKKSKVQSLKSKV